MFKVGLVGGRGYVGSELIKLLGGHSQFQVAYVGSSSMAGQNVCENVEGLAASDLKFADLDPQMMNEQDIDVWILAQSNGQAAGWLEKLKLGERKFLDVSADFRFDPEWVYGLPEANREQIKNARLVSNPGCYATAVQLALLPIIEKVDGVPSAFGISGYSGAGKTPSDRNNPDRLRDNILPYALTDHLHEKEVSFHLKQAVHFVPHVASFFRGITATVNVPIQKSISRDELMSMYLERYENESLVLVQSEIPEVVQVRESASCLLGGFNLNADGDRLVVVSVIDNLLKGAASQAVQNLNLMFGVDESEGLSEYVKS